MRIKHYSGYGCVTITKGSDRKYPMIVDGYMSICRQIMVKVVGNHERGLERGFYDPYCIHEWIGRRYAKGKNYTDLVSYKVLSRGYERNDEKHIDEEYAIYELIYK